MASVTGLTKERMEAIEDASVVSGEIVDGNLILTTFGGDEIDAGPVLGSVPDATDTVKGIVELATTSEASTGTDTTRAVTPAGLAAAVPAASTSAAGKVELATTGEATAGVSSTLAVTPAGLKAAVDAVLQLIYPVGSFYMSHSVSTDPNTLLGFGSWSPVAGKVLIGVDGTFTAGSTGGAQTHTLAETNLPAHTHGTGSLATTGGDHTHQVYRDFDGASGSARWTFHTSAGTGGGANTTGGTGAHSHGMSGSTGSTGSGTAVNHMPPWHAAYIWRRTA